MRTNNEQWPEEYMQNLFTLILVELPSPFTPLQTTITLFTQVPLGYLPHGQLELWHARHRGLSSFFSEDNNNLV